jgi:glucuronate isomerase
MRASNYSKTDVSSGFIHEDFLLSGDTARHLYHDYAKELPVIDYHNHLSPHLIAEDHRFANLTEIWLHGDHYKWRAMRALGVDEAFITGNGDPKGNFRQWAACLPRLIGNPLFHWSHMELKNTFGVNEFLNRDSADRIYDHCSERLQSPELSAHSILKSYRVEMVGTTDDPCDDLQSHWKLRHAATPFRVLPSFRPDSIFNIEDRESFLQYVSKLSSVSGIMITDMDSLLQALKNRIEFFHDCGCRIADHGLPHMPFSLEWSTGLEAEFRKFLAHKDAADFSDPDCFRGSLLIQLCIMYHQKGWVQQFHLGPIRNNNSRLLKKIGKDAGVDSIGDYPQALPLARFLDKLDASQSLAKTILYNINPADNEVFASMACNFNDGKITGKIQYGSGWWFLDQKDGIEKQISALSNMGVISTFIGMLTDSRSFLSYSRHEYFRRVLCNMFGQDMDKGYLPNDLNWVGGIIKDICYFNAKNYFEL